MTEPTTTAVGLDPHGFERWAAEHLPDASPPFRHQLIAGGHSNLTYKSVDRAGTAYAVRRPPLGHRLATAHDMGREHRILAALHPAGIPVPKPLGLCDDDHYIGAPFYVTAFVDGIVLRDAAAAAAIPEAARRQASIDLVDTLVAIHALPPDAVGLGTLGRHTDYIPRQLRQWREQVSRIARRDLPLVGTVHDRLQDSMPPERPASIVHGDYRIENTIIGPDGTLRAVLDWELCTLGDPLADLAALLVCWGTWDEQWTALPECATAAAGFPHRNEIAQRYGAVSDRDLSALPYYLAFAMWRLACILEGVHTRYLDGGLSGDVNIDDFANRVIELLGYAATLLDQKN